ncbi:MAG: hypothetical protein HY748_12765 [Elusimicrobia bacterium]|nr:hypothetical protein [Elusimicrobiota bacterium]
MSSQGQDSAVRPGAVRVERDGPVASAVFSGRGPGNIVSRSLMEDLVRELEALDIAEKAPLAVKAAKESVLEAEELDFEAGLEGK